MENEPLVSVIALCYNHQRFVLESLESIRHQSYRNIQLIIIDDGSQDHSVNLIQSWLSEHGMPSQFIKHSSNQGICKTLNEALSHAKGDFIAILATDDLWLKDKLKIQVDHFKSLGEEVGVLFSDAYRIDSEGQPLDGMFIEFHRKFVNVPQGAIFSVLLEGNFIPAPSVLIRRSCYSKVGFYDEQLSYEDWDMWTRMAYHYKFAFHSQVQTKYRVVSTSLSHILFSSPNAKSSLSHFCMNKKWLDLPDLTPSQRKNVKNSLTHHVTVLNELRDPNRGQYLKEALKYDFRLKTALRLFLNFLPPQVETAISSFLKKIKRIFRPI